MACSQLVFWAQICMQEEEECDWSELVCRAYLGVIFNGLIKLEGKDRPRGAVRL